MLAACSTHFSKLFSNSPLNGQLIVILDGTRHQDLQILLQFMYRGVAYLHQNRIESVLRTAEVLQVSSPFLIDFILIPSEAFTKFEKLEKSPRIPRELFLKCQSNKLLTRNTDC